MNEDEEALDTSGPETAYEVGYKKPPKNTRFKKGQSGNPSGKSKREKCPKGWKERYWELLNRIISVNMEGKRVRMPVLEAMMHAQIGRASKTDRAFAQVLSCLDRIEELRAEDHPHGGLLIVPAQMSMEDWEEVAKEQQRKFRDGSFYDVDVG